MRKVDVVRPPINYAVISNGHKMQIAWFVIEEDAQTFIDGFGYEHSLTYEIAEVRR